MKKFGFTLAEVLITLTIIGVVAMMTLPALMTNVQEQQAITGLKKGINTLSEAGQMNAAMSGFDYSSVTETGTKEDDQSLTGLFRSRLQVDLNASGWSSDTYTLNSNGKYVISGDKTKGSNYIVVFLRDGAAIAYKEDEKVTDSQNFVNVYYDINGAKGPNLLSNCDGSASKHIYTDTTTVDENETGGDDGAATIANIFTNFAGMAYADGTTGVTSGNCTDKTKRVIKDQFLLTLQGGYAVPADGSIAQWILNNK